MSLILDALKKSEAERQRGQPPTLHAHFSAPKRIRRTPWVAGAGAVLLAAGLAGGGLWLSRSRGVEGTGEVGNPIAQGGSAAQEVAGIPAEPSTPPPPATDWNPGAPATVAASTADAAPATAVQEVLVGGVAGSGDSGTISGGGLPVPQRALLYTPSVTPAPDSAVVTPPAGSGAAPATEVPIVAAVPTPPEPVAVPPPSVSAPPPPASADSLAPPAVDHGPSGPTVTEAAPNKPEEVLPVMFQLPYATRKDMPKLELSMHVFSPDPTERFIVLNGKRFTLETPAPGPELTLLDIVADGAVFEFRGQRFLLPRQTY